MIQRFFLRLALGVLLGLALTGEARAQYEIKWLSAGALHNWYSEIGGEIEEGFIKQQQYGLQWPAIYANQDMQAWKGLWIGAKNFTDEGGAQYPVKVVHVGPRVSGAGEFFPVSFDLISKFENPAVSVDGNPSEQKPVDIDQVDRDLPADRAIVNVVNTQLGLTMTRRILQFSQGYHDSYHVIEYTFTNTGNTDGDEAVELPGQTLQDVYVYLQWRWAVNANTRYAIGNPTGWGINTMLDTRGDGVKPDPAGQQYRAQIAWHGNFPPFTAYDNIGGPIWAPEANVAAGDTIGRLGATQFIGALTLHADRSAADETDDPAQPSTTSYIGSDEPYQSNNDPFNPVKMQQEYGLMSAGHQTPRHADRVEPSGNFLDPTGDPSLGTSGGFSAANGYGPYTIGPGESVRIVLAEAAAGLSREAQIDIGQRYKQGQIPAVEKNRWVMSGLDSLFQTFGRATANYASGYAIPQPPLPPSVFDVTSGGDRISLSWDVFDDAGPLQGFEIYRAPNAVDSVYTLIHTAGPDERSYDDRTPVRGLNYYYYIVAVGPSQPGGPGTPAGPLRSSRYYTQTYDPANLKRPATSDMDSIVVVPNPYNLGASTTIRYPEQDRLAFLNIPGRCTIRIYTETGELVSTIEHLDGTGDAYWDQSTASRQIVVSGLYIAVIDNLDTGERALRKFVIIR